MSDTESGSPRKKQKPSGGKKNPRRFKPPAAQQGGDAQTPQGGQGQRKRPPQQQRPAGQGQRPGKQRTGAPPRASSTEETRGLEQVVVRNEFYRDGYRTLLKVALVEGLVIIGLIAAMFFVVHVHQPENRYFATTEDGRLIPMVALNQPNLSRPALMSWAAQASTEVMTFGHHDYRRRLQEASRNFTNRGWASFTEALENARLIESIEANRQVLTAAPRGAPVLQQEGVNDTGRYQWIIQIPMVLTYESGARVKNTNVLVTLVIVRVPRLESPSGVGIAQWIQVGG